MTNSGDDRSVRTGDVIGGQISTGDNNTQRMEGVTVQLPPAEQVNPASELAELRSMLEALSMSDASSADLKSALDMAEAEAKKPEADKNWMGAAIERALKIAEGASDFSEKVEKISPKVKALASWLGKNWYKILAVIGIAG